MPAPESTHPDVDDWSIVKLYAKRYAKTLLEEYTVCSSQKRQWDLATESCVRNFHDETQRNIPQVACSLYGWMDAMLTD